MIINLTAEQRAMQDGRRGNALALSMRMLIAVAKSQGAANLIPAASAHVGLSLSSLGEAGVDLLESFAAEGARFAVPTTINVLSFQRDAAGTSVEKSADAALQMRALDAVRRMGAITGCSCNPFLQGRAPKFGESVAWSESATAPYINAVLGARTNREGATALASALTGLTPRYGLHLDAARRGGKLFRITARPDGLHAHHLLAAVVARRSGSAVPVLDGLAAPIAQESLYGFCAAFATYSAGAMFHITGVTPEAGSLAELFPDGVPQAEEIGDADLAAEQARLAACSPEEAGIVVIGCPHASLAQLQAIERLLAGRRLRAGRRVLVHTNREVRAEAGATGTLAALSAAGVQVTADTCAYVVMDAYVEGTALLTDSAKMAFLMASRGLRTSVQSTEVCMQAVSEAAQG